MTNKERLEVNNAKIEEITKALAKKQISPNDMLQLKVDATKSLAYLFYIYAAGDTYADVSEIKEILGNIDTSQVTVMVGMFSTGVSPGNFYRDLSEITIDCASCVYMNNMFQKQTYLIKSPKLLNTSNVTQMTSMFSGCTGLTDVQELDVLNSVLTNMFNNCSTLTNITLLNIKRSLVLSASSRITNESLINTIQQLWDLTGETIQTLTLHSTSKTNIANIYVKLVDVTDEMLAQDQYAGNKKPCVVCESTDEGAMTLTEYGISKGWAIA